jgi:DNA-binding transcriptional ArsR family regulator
MKTKDACVQELSSLLKLLGSPVRLKLVQFISYCPRSVEDCAEKIGESIQNTSLHLKALTEGRILNFEKIKNFRFYYLEDKRVLPIIAQAQDVYDQSLLSREKAISSISSELALEIRKGDTALVDLRTPEERSFLPVPFSIPFALKPVDAPAFIKNLSQQKIIFFCRGPLCERLASVIEYSTKTKKTVFGLRSTALDVERLRDLLET